jgi:hypothetical protein
MIPNLFIPQKIIPDLFLPYIESVPSGNTGVEESIEVSLYFYGNVGGIDIYDSIYTNQELSFAIETDKTSESISSYLWAPANLTIIPTKIIAPSRASGKYHVAISKNNLTIPGTWRMCLIDTTTGIPTNHIRFEVKPLGEY